MCRARAGPAAAHTVELRLWLTQIVVHKDVSNQNHFSLVFSLKTYQEA